MTTPKQKMGKMYSNILVPPAGSDGAREEDDADADPEGENAGHPKTDENAVIFVDQKPECDAGGKTGAGGKQEWSIDFVKHNFWNS